MAQHHPAASSGTLQRFDIRITTRHETALQTCVARDSDQAWDTAWSLSRQIMGDKPCGISVKPHREARHAH